MRFLVVLGLVAAALVLWVWTDREDDPAEVAANARQCLDGDLEVAVNDSQLEPEEPEFEEVGDVPDSLKYPTDGRPGVYLRGRVQNSCDRDVAHAIFEVTWGFVPWAQMDENEAPVNAVQEVDVGAVEANGSATVNVWFRGLPTEQFRGREYTRPDEFQVNGRVRPVKILFAP